MRFILMVLALTAQVRAAEKKPVSLVHIYCDFVLNPSTITENMDENWNSLVRHLDTRKPVTQRMDVAENAKFQKCLDQNSSNFDMGEFIVDGRDALQETLNRLEAEAAKPILLQTGVAQEDRVLSTPEFNISLELDTSNPPSGEEIIDAKSRIYSYQIQWSNFLEIIRKKTTPATVLNSFN